MKKLMLVLVGILIGIAAILLSIPRDLTASGSVIVDANAEGVFRYLRTGDNWKKWWPGETAVSPGGNAIFSYSDYRFSLEKVLYNSFEFEIRNQKDSIKGMLYLIPIQVSRFQLQWSCRISSGTNPIKKVRRYFLTKDLENVFDTILNKMSAHFSHTEHIYGLNIRNEKVEVQHLVSTRKTFPHYPRTQDIYGLVSQVKAHIESVGAKVQGQPMLNIHTSDSIHFNTQVAMPVDKDLPGTDLFTPKRMLKGGNILVSEVTGDKKKINEGFKSIEMYISDFHRSIIAIPFQVLITDRQKQTDSTKWITRLYYPVM